MKWLILLGPALALVVLTDGVVAPAVVGTVVALCALLLAYGWLRGWKLPGRPKAACQFRTPIIGRLVARSYPAGFIARHEAGHKAAAEYVGGRRVKVRVWEGGGVTNATIDDDGPKLVAFLLGGRYAVGSGAGCSYDDAQIRRILREYPPEQRAEIRRKGEQLARRAVSSRAGQIRRDAEKIEQRGKL